MPQRSLADNVIVITGASSGIGRAAALEFARRGCPLVLAARRGDALEETARACRALGGRALVVVTDVTREADVTALTEAAVAEFRAIDVWINNAGTTLFGALDSTPFEEHRRVIETNVYGAMLGARAVAPVFRRQKRGILVNVGSILSKIGQPFVPSYVISKFALRGLTETLRSEFAADRDIHVCSLLPYAVDTPHFEDGANRIGLPAHAMPPLQSPENVARALVRLVERPRRELHVPRVAFLGLALHAMFPRFVEKLILHVLTRWHFADREDRTGQGNLYVPSRDARVHGTRQPRLGGIRLLFWIVAALPRILTRAPRRPALPGGGMKDG